MNDSKIAIPWAFGWAGIISTLGFIGAEIKRLADFRINWLEPDAIAHLGGEYDNIAQAMFRGDGFSDPFGRQDGFTAWMPPVIPVFLQCLYWISNGDRTVVVFIISFVSWASAWLCLWTVLHPFQHIANRGVCIWVCCTSVLLQFHPLFQMSHDHLLLAPLACGLWLWFVYSWALTCRWIAWLNGILGGIICLSSPALGICWTMLTCVKYGYQQRSLLVSLGVSAFLVAPWMVRNRMEVSLWCPVKSNLFFDAWQAQVVSETGILDFDTLDTHPFSATSLNGLEYSQFGEANFLQKKKSAFFTSIKERPLLFVSKVFNRATAAFFWPRSLSRNPATDIFSMAAARTFTITASAATLLCITQCRKKLSLNVNLAVAIFVVYMLPYVLFSFYYRYALPMFPLQLYLILCAILQTRVK